MSFAIVADDLSFAWPDGEVVFQQLSFAVGPGRTGLVGANGSGKSTLLRLVAGELSPTGGSVRVQGSLGYLRQDLTLDAGLPVDEVLGIARARRALAAIERGEATEARFAAVGDDWDVEERARATLDRLGLGHLGLDRRLGQVSGGEAVLLGLAAQLLRRPDVLLLDEPTNNLDLDARRRLDDAVTGWAGVMVVVSHDRALLDLVDQVADLRDGELRWYGGNLTAYERAVAAEQEAAERLVRTAAADVQRQQRELRDARVKLDRRRRHGQKMWDTKREPKIIMGARKRQAQVSAGKHRGMHLEKLEESRQRLTEATQAVHDDDEIRVDLPGTAVPAGRTVLTVHQARLRNGARVELEVRGPERVALLGPNGAGKTTLLETIVGTLDPLTGTVAAVVPCAICPSAWTGSTRRPGSPPTWPGSSPAPPTTPSGPAWPGSCSAATGPTSRWAPCRAANGSGPPWPPCSWPSRHPAAAARRADQQPGHGRQPPAGPGPGRLPGRPAGGQPRPALPALHRHHPLAAAGGPPDRDRPALTRWRTLSGRAGVSRMSRAELLLTQMDEVYARLRGRLAGLTDDEYFRQPVPGCWTVHRDPSGAWVSDYAEPDPDPAPFTTIGWRLAHLADCKVMYHEWAFGERRLRFPDLAAPASAAAALARLEEGQRRLRADLAGLGDHQLDEPRWTNWGERWPAWRILWTMIDHDAHHGAEIGCLRDLYRATAAGG